MTVTDPPCPPKFDGDRSGSGGGRTRTRRNRWTEVKSYSPGRIGLARPSGAERGAVVKVLYPKSPHPEGEGRRKRAVKRVRLESESESEREREEDGGWTEQCNQPDIPSWSPGRVDVIMSFLQDVPSWQAIVFHQPSTDFHRQPFEGRGKMGKRRSRRSASFHSPLFNCQDQ